MLSLLLNVGMLRCFAEFIVLYLGESPSIDEIRDYMQAKLEEKDIAESYKAGLITQEEVCAFLSAHLYTGFVLNHRDVREVSDEAVEDFHRRVKTLVFESK